MAEFIAQEDERVLKAHGFKNIYIPCERLEIVLQRDRKDTERRRIKLEREQRMRELEEKRKKKLAAREANGTDDLDDAEAKVNQKIKEIVHYKFLSIYRIKK